MKTGAVALAQVQQADGRMKPRPVVVLQEMPPYRDWLVCAVSSQLRHECQGFDEIISTSDDDFKASGLKVSSLIRLGLIATIPRSAFLGVLGAISEGRLERLQRQLAAHIRSKTQP
jgi:mRNA interferase MazF